MILSLTAITEIGMENENVFDTKFFFSASPPSQRVTKEKRSNEDEKKNMNENFTAGKFNLLNNQLAVLFIIKISFYCTVYSTENLISNDDGK